MQSTQISTESSQHGCSPFKIGYQFSSQEDDRKVILVSSVRQQHKSHASHDKLLELLEIEQRDGKRQIDSTLEKSPQFKGDRTSRRNLMLCATSVTVTDSSINNLPESPSPKARMPKHCQLSLSSFSDSQQEAMPNRTDRVHRYIPKIDQDDIELA